MSKKSISLIMLIAGLVSAVFYILLGNEVTLPLKIILKIIPTLLMCSWLIMMEIDSSNWPIFVGIVFSMICDVAMALDGESFLVVGIAANMLGLVFYTIYFVKTDNSLDLIRFVPSFVIIGVMYFVLYDNLGAFKLPVLVYCVLYVVFMWRSTARLGDPTISVVSQYVCYIGSVVLTVSDCLLSLLLFEVIPYKNKYYALVMLLWWSGLLLLMLTAEIKRNNMKKGRMVSLWD